MHIKYIKLSKTFSLMMDTKPKTADDLGKLIRDLIKIRGNNADLNDIDTSLITDMNNVFSNSKFNGDISKWDVSKVTNMSFMFSGSKFNGDISKWNVSNVTDMEGMFKNSPLQSNPPQWYKNL